MPLDNLRSDMVECHVQEKNVEVWLILIYNRSVILLYITDREVNMAKNLDSEGIHPSVAEPEREASPVMSQESVDSLLS